MSSKHDTVELTIDNALAGGSNSSVQVRSCGFRKRHRNLSKSSFSRRTTYRLDQTVGKFDGGRITSFRIITLKTMIGPNNIIDSLSDL